MSMLLSLTADPSCHYCITLSLGAGEGKTSYHLLPAFPYLSALHLNRLSPSNTFPVVLTCLDQFVLLTSLLFIIFPPPHSCALYFQTTHFLVWPSLYSLKLNILLAQGWTFWFCLQPSMCIFAAVTSVSFAVSTSTAILELAKPEPQTVTPFSEFCSFYYSRNYLSVFRYKQFNVKNYFLL